ncbi:hypothetical protein RO3G_13036 [Rhizopus delemar RA 99-880]|uniref:Uncharacterized protein n=1 Tax=Rhizopus delemar (strain RA 99-880 / ATCC MYA-4621 / FGSC 9543 / NRRL 43880) TaxID=246409 RepID=I1CIP5_RHIO9|nr:hypothetical protein RO3G_13036 [Rhizopus delemar RA 99-880]|eukprot:EIE88325.1 hypothetical protein RO3G_13036 [Rhizopus delemar RA 99-880]
MIKQQSTHIKNKKGPMESSKRSSMSTTITNGSNNKSLTEGEEKERGRGDVLGDMYLWN